MRWRGQVSNPEPQVSEEGALSTPPRPTWQFSFTRSLFLTQNSIICRKLSAILRERRPSEMTLTPMFCQCHAPPEKP